MQSGLVQTRINGGLRLSEYREGIRFGTDALLLAHFAKERLGCGRVADFGTGSGILPLLFLSFGTKAHFTAYEIQEKYALLAKKNMEDNGFDERVSVVCGDLRDCKTLFRAGEFDCVVSNPPYLPTDCGRKNPAIEKRLAWHEDSLRVEELARSASYALKNGGKFFCVYLPSRMAELLFYLKENGLEPKRLQPVAPSAGEKPSLFLLEAKKSAFPGLEMLPTLCLYTDASHTTATEVSAQMHSDR